MAYSDLMIDIETLGVRDNAVITQIGLVAFDLTGYVHNTIGVNLFIDPADAIKQGQKVDWSTISWWLKQNDTARLTMANRQGLPLRTALIEMGDFIEANTVGAEKVRPWGNGATFDITLLEQAIRLTGLTVPWSYRNVRDLRTLADIETAWGVEKPKPAVEHDALADARAQADWARKLYAAILARPAPALPSFDNGQ